MRRGWKRLSIALSVPYFGFWGLLLIFSEHQSTYFAKLYEQDIAAGGRFNSAVHFKLLAGASNTSELAFIWGVLPLIALIVLLIARWVYLGFKADRTAASQ